MKIEFRSKIRKYASGRFHIEIPSYVREDIENFIGKCIKVSIQTKPDKLKKPQKLKFESRVSTYGPERVHIEIPVSAEKESKKLLGEKIIITIETK